MSHKPGFFEDTLPDLGRTTEDAAVASRIAALEAAMRELDMVAIERLIAPIYIHVDRDGCVMNRDE